MSEQKLPTYDSVEGALLCLKALGSAAETHGLLTALFSSGAKMRKQAWVNSLLTTKIEQNDKVAQDAKQTLERLFEVTVAQLQAQDGKFTLLLPDDDTEIEVRIESLGQWCQGFMSGLSLLGVDPEKHEDTAVKEAMRDLTKIACVAFQNEKTGNQEDESNYCELVEYVRTAVQLFSVVNEQEKPPQQGVQSSEALH